MKQNSTGKRKTVTAVTAVVLAAAIALSGTFAWQSINQEAVNETLEVVNPGGRLHDDFNGTNKDIYVENFTKVSEGGTPIYARVRLDEYMEIGEGAGLKPTDPDYGTKTAQSIIPGATIDNLDSWQTHIPGSEEDSIFHQYWNWATGGQTVYMPTFNLNKDSLESDINGTYAATDPADATKHYFDYQTYNVGDTEVGDEVRDADTNEVDEGAAAVEGVNITTTADQTHTAQETLEGTVMTMQEWIDGGSVPGPYWVWDTDGWAYWAQAIQPETATGLLLDEIQLAGSMGDSWYYGINVVGQFITADDLGVTNNTGFYDAEQGSAPTPEALKLLEKIGVADAVPAFAETIAAIEPGSTDTVTIDGVDFYVLAKDEVNNQALLITEEAITEAMAFDADSVAWDGSDMQTFLNQTWLSRYETLGMYAVPTDINTAADYTDSAFVISNDRVFLLSKADVDTSGTATTAAEDEYTYGGAPLPAPGGTWATTRAGAECAWWLRSPYYVADNVAFVELASQNAVLRATQYNQYDATLGGGVRPALWVSLDSPIPQHVTDIAKVEAASANTVTIDGIEWYVLKKEADKALLLSKDILEEKAFDADSVVWEGSEMQTYLNGSWLEQYNTLNRFAMPTTFKTRTAAAASDYIVSTDRVFLLSEADVFGTWQNDTTDVQADDYTISGTQLTGPDNSWVANFEGAADGWYLRSSYNVTNNFVAYVTYAGNLDSGGSSDARIGLRPAMWISLDPSYTEPTAPAHAQSIAAIDAASTDTVTMDGIEWYVLAKENDKALLLSKYVLEQRRFDDDSNVWEGSEVQKYLNGEWLIAHPTMGKYALTTTLTNRKSPDVAGTAPADFITSNNKIFMLSEADIDGSFKMTAGAAVAGDYTIVDQDGNGVILTAPGASTAGAGEEWQATLKGDTVKKNWWLRSTMADTDYVTCFAFISKKPASANVTHTVESTTWDAEYAPGIRPAVWVKLPYAASVTVSSAGGVSMATPDSTLQLSAAVTVSGVDAPAQDVTWEVIGAADTNTTVTDGLLTIGANETETLTVKATSAVYGVSATKTIKVVPAYAQTIYNIGEGSTQTVTLDGINFYVLATDEANARALLITQEIQEQRAFHDDSANTNMLIWRDSTLRTYLNNAADSSGWLYGKTKLNALVKETTLQTRETPTGTTYVETADKVFLLSEADFAGTASRQPTDDAREYTYNGTKLNFSAATASANYQGAALWWLLRSLYSADGTALQIAAVTPDGVGVAAGGGGSYVPEAGIRPALWVALDVFDTSITLEDTVPPSTPVPDFADEIAAITPGDTTTVTIDGVAFYVLAKDTTNNRALLLSQNILEERAFDDSDNVWEGSTMQTYLNNETDSSGWLYDKPTLKQWAAETTFKTRDEYNATTFTQSTDKVFLLSEADVFNTQNNNTGGITPQTDDFTYNGTNLTAPGGSWIATNGGTADWWWLRSPYNYANNVAYVGSNGYLSINNYANAYGGVRPALWVNLES